MHLQQDLIISSRTSIATTRTEKASLHFGGQVYQIPVFSGSFCLGRSFPFFFRRILHHERSLVHLHHPASTASADTSVAAQANTCRIHGGHAVFFGKMTTRSRTISDLEAQIREQQEAIDNMRNEHARQLETQAQTMRDEIARAVQEQLARQTNHARAEVRPQEEAQEPPPPAENRPQEAQEPHPPEEDSDEEMPEFIQTPIAPRPRPQEAMGQPDDSDPDDSSSDDSEGEDLPRRNPPPKRRRHTSNENEDANFASSVTGRFLAKLLTEKDTGRRLRIKAPEPFDGAYSKFRMWWESMEEYLYIQRRSVPDDEIRILTVGTFLKDEAKVWYATRRRELRTKNRTDSWKKFTSKLVKTFTDQ